MARLRAVVMIQARGRAGRPSRGQRISALAKASWIASSARSMSPRMRASVARALPYSSRKTRAIAALSAAVSRTP